MLKVEGIDVYYGAIMALRQLSLEVNEGEIVTLIGANGAGKSTTLRAISGTVKPKAGNLRFGQTDLGPVPAAEVVRMGISQVPEGRRVFANMSVEENLQMGAYLCRDKAEIRRNMQEVFTRFPRLAERRRQLAGTLSGGEQQMLAIGRALMSHPKLLLLDEPSMGLAPILVQEIFAIIRSINAQGTTILLVEQNAHMALSVAHRAYVLETGRIVHSGLAKELAADEKVKSAYLGG